MIDVLSRDRVLSAVNHKEPDHVPLMFKWALRRFFKDTTWHDQFERTKMELKLGLDPVLNLCNPPAWKLDPDVKVVLWRENSVAGEEYPPLVKEYHTKKGVLKLASLVLFK